MSKDYTLSNFDNGKTPDVRKDLAVLFLAENGNGVYEIHKAPRSGATIGFIAAAADRNERILVLEPNGYIATKTVTNEAKDYCREVDTDIVRIPGNHECLKIEEMIKECPPLKKLKVIPLPEKCGECELYTECPLTEIVRKQDTLHGATMTYHKLAALMLAPWGKKDAEDIPMSKQILEIIQQFPIILLDEAHVLQEATEVKIVTQTLEMGRNFDATKYAFLENLYPTLATVAEAFCSLLASQEYKEGVEKVTAMLNEDHKNHHVRYVIKNPKVLEVGYKFTMEFFNGLVDLIKELEELHKTDFEAYRNISITTLSVAKLFDMFNIVTSERLSVGGDINRWAADNTLTSISVTGLDSSFYRMLREFFHKIDTRKKRILISSATLGTTDLSGLFNKYTKISQHLYGARGDPKRANDKMLFIADSRRDPHYSNSRKSLNMIDGEIAFIVSEAVKKLGEDGVMITAMNKDTATYLKEALEHLYCLKVDVNYYRSDKSMGIKHDARLHIVVGAAFIPVHSYDPVCENLEDSRKLREEIIQAATYQAMTRVKDSAGLEPSAVMGIYCTKEDMDRITTWGMGRTLFPNLPDTGSCSFEYEVFIGLPTNPPTVIESDNLSDMLNKALAHLGWGKRPDVRVKRAGTDDGEKSTKVNAANVENSDDFVNIENVIGVNVQKSSVLTPNSPNMYSIVHIGSFSAQHGEFFNGICKDVPYIVKDIKPVTPLLYQDIFDSFQEVEKEEPVHDYETTFVVSEISQILSRKLTDTRAAGYRLAEDTYTVDSLAEFRNRFESQLEDPNCVIVEKPQTYRTPIELLRRLIVNTYNNWYKQKDDGTYSVETHKKPELFQQKVDQALKSHLDGLSTFGMPAIDSHAYGIWGCIDIDAHRKPDDTEETMGRKAFHAKASVQLLLDYMRSRGIPYMLEKSGSANSYHIWVFFLRTNAKKIQYFMRSLVICAGIDYRGMKIEINPKQTNFRKNTTDSRTIGNQVKMPFALHRAKGTRSMVFNENATGPAQKWQGIDERGRSNFEPMVCSLVNIGGLEPVDEDEILITVKAAHDKLKAETASVVTPDNEEWFIADATNADGTGGGKQARFYEWALSQDLRGSDGNSMRVFIARFYLNQGLSREEVAKLFSKQSDYDYNFSLKMVGGIARHNYGHVRYNTIREYCGDLVSRFEKETGLILKSNAV